MSSEAASIYQLYVDEKGIKPKITNHLTAFAKTKGLKIKYVDAKKIIASPPSVVLPDTSTQQNEHKHQNNYINSPRNNKSNNYPSVSQTTLTSFEKCTDCGRSKKGKIYESDGLFYCLECWDTYDEEYAYNVPEKRKEPNSNTTFNQLTKMYDEYVTERGEKPSNTFDLINYIQYNGIHGIVYKDISQFLMNHTSKKSITEVTEPKTLRNRAATTCTVNHSDSPSSLPNHGIKSTESVPVRQHRSRALTNAPLYTDDTVSELYQIYYKCKGMKAFNARQLLKYGKSIKVDVKWREANKFLKNSSVYLASLVTPPALQTVVVPQMKTANSIQVKVCATDSEYYWIKDLSLNSKIEDICDRLEPRLQQTSTKINLYKDEKLLSRKQTLQQFGLKNGDSVVLHLGVHNTSVGMDSFLQTSLTKKQYYQQFQSLSNLAIINQSTSFSTCTDCGSLKKGKIYNELFYCLECWDMYEMETYDEKTDAVDAVDIYTENILSNAASGNASNRDTLLHVMSGLAEANGQKCVFFNSKEGIKPADAVEHDSHLHIVEANNDKNKTFVLTLDSLKNTEEKNGTDVSDAEVYEMQKCIEAKQTQSHPLLNDIQMKLSKVHSVLLSRIQIIGVFIGSFNVEYTISDLSIQEIDAIRNSAGEMQQKMDDSFDGYQRLNIHPILFRQSYDIAMFDEAGNKTFGTQHTYQVGKDKNGASETYTQPLGWTRYGLSVLNKYEDNKWLKPFQDDSNWYRAYHGTGSGGKGATAVDAMSSIYNGGFNISFKDRRNGTRAVYGDGVYVSPNPEFVNSRYASTISIDTKHGSKNFKFMLMVAVKPDSVVKDRKDIWHILHAKDVRPYGILIKEC